METGAKVELYKYKYITSLTKKKWANVLETVRRGLLTTEKVVYQAVTVYSSFAVIGVANRPPDLNLNCGAVEVGLNVIRVVRGGGGGGIFAFPPALAGPDQADQTAPETDRRKQKTPCA